MKKVLSNLINIDINNILINSRFIKYIFFFLCLLINNCDNPQAPTWESEINLPLLSTSYEFSEMTNSEGIFENEELITLEFGNTILDGMGIPPEYFVTPGFELNPFSFSLSEIINQIDIPTISFGETVEFPIPNEFPFNTGECIDANTSHGEIFSNIEGIPISVPTEALSALFSDYEYMTVDEGNMVLILNDESFLYPLKIEYTLSSEVNGINTDIFSSENPTIDSYKDIGEEIIFDYTILIDNEGDFNCTQCSTFNPLKPYETDECNGFIVNPELDYSINLNGQVNIDNIYSITGTTNSFNPSVEESFPLVNNVFDILAGEISSNMQNNLGEAINQLEFQVTNNSQIPLSISFDLLNFKDANGEILELGEFVVNPNGANAQQIKSFSGSSIEYYSNLLPGPDEEQKAIDEIYMGLDIVYPADQGTFVLNNLYNFDVNGVSIRPIEFDKITTVVHDFIVDVPSLSLSSVPSGIEGIEFKDPVLTLNLDNMIEISNTLSFNLEALFEGEIVSSISIEADINVPEMGSNESVLTQIVLDDDTYTVYHGDVVEGIYQLENSLIEFLKVQSDELTVSGQASLNGTGNIEPGDETFGKTISGDFELNVPFTMILGEEIDDEYTDINIIPAQETYLSPIDSSTKESIDNSFIEAKLVSSIINHSPFVGVVSILVSTDENFFPLNLDQLINDEDYSTCLPYCVYPDNNESVFMAIKDSLQSIEESNGQLNIGLAEHINRVEYIPISNTDSRIKHLRLFTENDSLLISRLAMLELPYPIINDDGYVEEAGKNDYVSLIDDSQISLINYTDLDKPRYMNTLITLVNSHSYSNSDDPEDSGIINITVNDSIKITSYSSFLLNVGDY